MRGYFGIGIENGKTSENIGTLWRTANIFDAAFIFTVGQRYKKQCSDTLQTHRHIPLNHYQNVNALYDSLPYSCQLIGVELTAQSIGLRQFKHPERAMYLLGAEDHGLSSEAYKKCHYIIQVPTAKEFCLNVSVAGALVMYDRFNKCVERVT